MMVNGNKNKTIFLYETTGIFVKTGTVSLWILCQEIGFNAQKLLENKGIIMI